MNDFPSDNNIGQTIYSMSDPHSQGNSNMPAFDYIAAQKEMRDKDKNKSQIQIQSQIQSQSQSQSQSGIENLPPRNFLSFIHDLWSTFLSGDLIQFGKLMCDLQDQLNRAQMNAVLNTLQSDLKSAGIPSIVIDSVSGLPYLQIHRMLNQYQEPISGVCGFRQTLRFRPGESIPAVIVAYFQDGRKAAETTPDVDLALSKISKDAQEIFTALSAIANQNLAKQKK